LRFNEIDQKTACLLTRFALRNGTTIISALDRRAQFVRHSNLHPHKLVGYNRPNKPRRTPNQLTSQHED